MNLGFINKIKGIFKKQTEPTDFFGEIPYGKFPFLDTSVDPISRAKDLISRMTLEEKVSQMWYKSRAIPHLFIHEYDWWNECLHGVARAGIATVFPQAIGIASTFNPELVYQMADVISTEARAKHHEFARKGERGRYKGLTFWSPNINIFRDPRWGRGQETYGEDPYLSGTLGVQFVRGLQGTDPKYLKLVATPKHFAVHSGPEKYRHSFNAVVSEKDLRETYLPHFKMTVEEANAASVMGAYNRTNGEPCCGSRTLLENILREEWGFSGYVVSDCGAIADFHRHHKVTKNAVESAAYAVKNGCDLNCGRVFKKLTKAAKKGLITEQEIDKAVTRLMEARIRLGMFDPPENVSYASIPYELNDCEEHRAMSLEVAKQSLVLLKNKNKILPLKKELKKIAVIGPNADSLDVLLGNYNGTPSRYTTLLSGIRQYLDKQIIYEKGCNLKSGSEEDIKKAVNVAKTANAVILAMGISPKMEGEQRIGGDDDRKSLELPQVQQKLLEQIVNARNESEYKNNIVLVIFGGSPFTLNWAQDYIPAIIEAWYPGEEGGKAISELIFGDYSPSGKLPITFVKSLDDIPAFTDYNMQGRTYRFMKKEPLYPFGFGLSYTEFNYTNANLEFNNNNFTVDQNNLNEIKFKTSEICEDSNIKIKADVTNTGSFDSYEVSQLYLQNLNGETKTNAEKELKMPNGSLIKNRPIFSLQGVKKTFISKGETKSIEFLIKGRQLASYAEDGTCWLEPCRIRFHIGGFQPDDRTKELLKENGVEQLKKEFYIEISLEGQPKQLKY